MSSTHRLIVLGLDGASLNVLGPLVEAGHLPTFSEAFRSGSVGNLHVDPLERGWPAILCGEPVDYLGSFYYRRTADRYVPEMGFSGNEVIGNTLLDHLSRIDLNVLSVNLPLTYPAWQVRGTMVSGAGGGSSPTVELGVYPKNLLSEYPELFKNYAFDLRQVNYLRDSPSKMMSDLMSITRQRQLVIRSLMTSRPWDVAFPTFVGLDRLQHWLWDAIPVIGTRQDTRLSRQILDYFLLLDGFLGDLLEDYSDSRIIAVSDHGFQRLTQFLFINNLLREGGFLKKRTAPKARLTRSLRKIGRRLPALRQWALRRAGTSRIPERAFLASHDWENSVAYGFRAPGVYLNTAQCPEGWILEESPEYDVISKEITDFLMDSGPLSKSVVRDVKGRKDAYSGPYSGLAPDLLLDLAEETEILPEHVDGSEITLPRRSATSWDTMPRERQGIHSTQAFFLAVGPGIRKTEIPPGFRLQDLPATILDLLGVENPFPRSRSFSDSIFEEQ